jgi:hypothetical protein
MTVTAINTLTQRDVKGLSVSMAIVADAMPDFITVKFSDQIFNAGPVVTKQITNFTENDGAYSATATLTESEMEQIHGTDFTRKVRMVASKMGAPSAVINNLVWNAAPVLADVTSTSGAEKINLRLTLNENYIAGDICGSVIHTTRRNILNPTAATIALVQDADDANVYTGVVTGLALGEEYEIQVSVENKYGESDAITLQNVMTSLNPGTVSIDYFDSLDASGAIFNFTVDAYDYSDYSDLYLKLNYKVGSTAVGTETSIDVDICGVTNPAHPHANRSFKINRKAMTEANKSAIENALGANRVFTVEAKLEANIDVSGLVSGLTGNRTYTGPVVSRNYIMDQDLPDPVVTLSAVEWYAGAQTVRAVLDGCANNITFTYDLSGAESTVTSYDICGVTQKMTAHKTYNYIDLNNEGKTVKVMASRPEANGGASLSKSDKVELDFKLKAIKRAESPTAEITVDLTVPDVEFKFTSLPDLSYTDVYAVVKSYTGLTLVSGDAYRDTSGNATITLTHGDLVPGARYTGSAHTRYDMESAGFNTRYKTLNGNSKYLLSTAQSTQFVYSSQPTLNLYVRPTDASSNELRVVRMTGEMNGNDVVELICYAKDVCGNVMEKRLAVDASSRDSCGNNISGSTLSDFADAYDHDFTFDKAVEVSSGMFVVGIVDTANALDAITVKQSAHADATDFANAAADYNAALAAYNAALDASNNKLLDASYNELYTTYNNLEISYNELSANLISWKVQRDGSGVGSEWAETQATNAQVIPEEKYQIAYYNHQQIASAISLFDISLGNLNDAAAELTYQSSGVITFQKAVYDVSKAFVAQPLDGSFVTMTVTGTSSNFLELQLDALKTQYQAAQTNAYNVKFAADNAASAAAEANSDLDGEISDGNTNLPTLNTSKTTAKSNLDTRAAQLVTAAATAKTTLTTETSDLNTARAKFFPDRRR